MKGQAPRGLDHPLRPAYDAIWATLGRQAFLGLLPGPSPRLPSDVGEGEGSSQPAGFFTVDQDVRVASGQGKRRGERVRTFPLRQGVRTEGITWPALVTATVESDSEERRRAYPAEQRLYVPTNDGTPQRTETVNQGKVLMSRWITRISALLSRSSCRAAAGAGETAGGDSLEERSRLRARLDVQLSA